MVRVTCVGICASDGKMFAGADFYWGPGGRAKRGGVVTGHEFVGTVVALGAGAATKYAAEDGSPLQIGDQVTMIMMMCECRTCGKALSLSTTKRQRSSHTYTPSGGV